LTVAGSPVGAMKSPPLSDPDQAGRRRYRDPLPPQQPRKRTAPMKWTDSEEIAVALCERYPDVDPLSVRFTELHQWVCQLDDFADEPHRSNEAKLEAIQMAWLEERRDNRPE
jgi:FeS assembly protein IscX